jgi:hypothetical protein
MDSQHLPELVALLLYLLLLPLFKRIDLAAWKLL